MNLKIAFLFLTTILLAISLFPVKVRSEVLYPPDMTLTNDKTISIYGFVEDGKAMEGEVNFVRKFELDGEEFFQGEVELFQGMNIIKLGGDTLRIFAMIGSDLQSFTVQSGDRDLTFYSYAVHPALGEGCESCHSYDGGDITLNDDVKALCFECHDDPTKDDAGETRAFIHGPVFEEECTECHDPHFSKNKKLLTQEKICLECHDDKDPKEGENESVHEPVGKMECTSCHDPHSSPHKYQLKREGVALCFGCHGDFTKDDGGREFEFVHEPVAGGECFSCHEPHFSVYKKLLTEEKICLKCHDDKDPEGGDYISVHTPVTIMECASCHDPHASPNPYQFEKAGNKLCYTCHEKPHDSHRSAKIEGTSVHIPEKFPVDKDGSLSCLGCHDPHFTENRRLFKEEEAKLCIKCHKM